MDSQTILIGRRISNEKNVWPRGAYMELTSWRIISNADIAIWLNAHSLCPVCPNR
jgi:hypothetical protein